VRSWDRIPPLAATCVFVAYILLFHCVICRNENLCTHVYAVSCSLRDEFEDIARKALTTPANTKELMELKSFVEKVESETMYDLERKLIRAKSTLAFLLEYTHVSPAEMRSNAEMFKWYERMPSIFDEHRAIIADKRLQYEEALKVGRRMKILFMYYNKCECATDQELTCTTAQASADSQCCGLVVRFLPRDASAERGNATVSRPSVCLSVCLSVCP